MTVEPSKKDCYRIGSLSIQRPFMALVASLIIILVTILVVTISADSAEALVDHDLIDIRGSSDLTSENGVVSGSGSSTDPYIIEGWSINASTFHAVLLNNIHTHLVIRNIVLYYH